VKLSFIIGVDGGGTGTRARINTLDGAVLGSGAAGPSALGQGVEQAWAHVQQAIANGFAAAGQPVADARTCALGLGVAGAIVPSLRAAFVKAAPSYAQLVLDEDAYTMLLGAHAGRPGAVVAAGTGSVGAALHANGERARVGGWGFPVGDEGSGAWLGLAAMRVAQHAVDGIAPAGALARAVGHLVGASLDTSLDTAGSATRAALLDWCEHAGQHEYAQLAPLVFESAATDPLAERLLDDAVRTLAMMAHCLDPKETLPLALLGSIGQRLVARLPPSLQARRVEAAGDAIDGALRLIRQRLPQGAA